MLAQLDRRATRRRVRRRIRKKISGTPERPRVAVFRSLRHIYAQAIDDLHGRTVAHVSTQDEALRADLQKGWNIEAATRVGQAMAEKLKGAGVEAVILDRGGAVYHGRIKAVADALRAGGLRL